MLPGLMRTLSTPCAMASSASGAEKWMSATSGILIRRLMLAERLRLAHRRDRDADQLAARGLEADDLVEGGVTSAVSPFVMVWTRIGCLAAEHEVAHAHLARRAARAQEAARGGRRREGPAGPDDAHARRVARAHAGAGSRATTL